MAPTIEAQDGCAEVQITQTLLKTQEDQFKLYRVRVFNPCPAQSFPRCGPKNLVLYSNYFKAFQFPSIWGEMSRIDEHDFSVLNGGFLFPQQTATAYYRNKSPIFRPYSLVVKSFDVGCEGA